MMFAWKLETPIWKIIKSLNDAINPFIEAAKPYPYDDYNNLGGNSMWQQL